jgi:hypothetical protein
MQHKSFPTQILSMGSRDDDCPPELIGTAWDPFIADGSPVVTKSAHDPRLEREWKRIGEAFDRADRLAELDRETKTVAPVKVACFEC